MRRPVWIALPFIALLLGAAVYELASEPDRVPVAKPVPVRQSGPSPEISATPSIAPLPSGAALQDATPLESREVFVRVDDAPRLEPPSKPPLESDSDDIVRKSLRFGEARYAVHQVPVESDYRATVERVVSNSEFREADVVFCTFIAIAQGKRPAWDLELQVFDTDGRYVCSCECTDRHEYQPSRGGKTWFRTTNQRMGTEILPDYVVRPIPSLPERHGLYQSWRDDGSADSEGQYNKGLRDGDWTWWHPNGTVAAVGRYEKGLRVGTWRLWYEDGRRHGVWEESRQEDKYRGWQVWGKDGEPHPCFDSEFLDLTRDGIRGVKERRYEDAVEHFTQLEQKLRELPEEYAQDWMLQKLKTVRGKLDTILTTDSDDTREGERLLLLFVDMKPLENAFISFAPDFPD